jgi:hypothetical protein
MGIFKFPIEQQPNGNRMVFAFLALLTSKPSIKCGVAKFFPKNNQIIETFKLFCIPLISHYVTSWFLLDNFQGIQMISKTETGICFTN